MHNKKWLGFKWEERESFYHAHFEVVEYLGIDNASGRHLYKVQQTEYDTSFTIWSALDIEIIASRKALEYFMERWDDIISDQNIKDIIDRLAPE